LPVDLLIDLYRNSNLRDWIDDPTLSRRFWGRWGIGDAVSWPEDALHFDKSDIPMMASLYAQSDGTWLSSVICEKMIDLISMNPELMNLPELDPAKLRAIKVLEFGGNDVPHWFDRLPAENFLSVCRVIKAIPLLEMVAATWTTEPEHSRGNITLELLRSAK
jgi:hypothetical protein